ncbi:uncharacterized protein LOC122832099 isoform X2 [Gambusia affinis]|uniref:uncharacterized protein LOC122832099 isoform X2 n=1 Tax=Gambusia affinis TaxID=33528 RepID=UPI001CDBD4DB|nr:uncharacterized protein LOC122832099 isoform X2 [Gambusia affinis]
MDMNQQQIVSEHEAFPAELSWLDMMDLNIQVDYDEVISFEDDGDSPIKPEDESAEIKGESGPSGDSDSPTSLEVKQETTPSAGFEVSPSVEVLEEKNQHIADLKKQLPLQMTPSRSSLVISAHPVCEEGKRRPPRGA